MLNCEILPDGRTKYTLVTFDKVNKIILWKRSHFKTGDFFRVKGINGSIKEVEIESIGDNGVASTIEYSSFRWYDGKKKHKKGKMTHSVTFSSFFAEDMFADLQERGHTFHKIKKLSPKYQKIKTHFNIKW